MNCYWTWRQRRAQNSARLCIGRDRHIHTRDCRMENNRLEEPEFRLLAAVYAALGPDTVGALVVLTLTDLTPAQRSIWKYCEALRS